MTVLQTQKHGSDHYTNCDSEYNCRRGFQDVYRDELLESWLTVKADVEAEPGGKYELFWEPDAPDNNSTIGCKVLAVDRPGFISFEWKGPKQYKHFMNNVQPLTNVTVLFTPLEERTKVETDLDGNIVREIGLQNGLVDVKVCAVDNIWSGLKFVIRLENRKK